jgi:hypothetical protein
MFPQSRSYMFLTNRKLYVFAYRVATSMFLTNRKLYVFAYRVATSTYVFDQ